jgi:hypothetical protein
MRNEGYERRCLVKEISSLSDLMQFLLGKNREVLMDVISTDYHHFDVAILSLDLWSNEDNIKSIFR